MPSLIRVACPGCQTVLQFEATANTQMRVNCPTCNMEFLCNAPAASPSPASTVASTARPTQSTRPATHQTNPTQSAWEELVSTAPTSSQNYAQPNYASTSSVWQPKRKTKKAIDAGLIWKIVGIGGGVGVIGAICIAVMMFGLPSWESISQIGDSHAALVADFEEQGRELRQNANIVRPTLPNDFYDDKVVKADKLLRRYIRLGWMDSAVAAEEQPKLRDRIKQEIQGRMEFAKQLTPPDPKDMPSFPKLEEMTPTQQAVFQWSMEVSQAANSYIGSCFGEPCVAKTDIERQILKEADLRFKLAKTLVNVRSSYGASQCRSAISKLKKEFEESYVESPKIGMVYKSSEEVLARFRASTQLYVATVEWIEHTLSPSEDFANSIAEIEDMVDRSNFGEGRFGSGWIEGRIAKRASKKSMAAIAKANAEKHEQVTMPAKQRASVSNDKPMAATNTSDQSNNTLNSSAKSSPKQSDANNASSANTAPSNSLASNPPSTRSDTSVKVEPEQNNRSNQRPSPMGFSPPPGYAGGGPNNFGPGSFPFGPGSNGNRESMRPGNNPPDFGPPPGSMKTPDDFKPPTGARLTIEGVDSIQLGDCINELCKKLQISSNSWSSNNNQAKVGLAYAGSMKELRDAIDFGKVIKFDEKERRLTIQANKK